MCDSRFLRLTSRALRLVENRPFRLARLVDHAGNPARVPLVCEQATGLFLRRHGVDILRLNAQEYREMLLRVYRDRGFIPLFSYTIDDGQEFRESLRREKDIVRGYFQMIVLLDERKLVVPESYWTYDERIATAA